jgi:hypothetical protein
MCGEKGILPFHLPAILHVRIATVAHLSPTPFVRPQTGRRSNARCGGFDEPSAQGCAVAVNSRRFL